MTKLLLFTTLLLGLFGCGNNTGARNASETENHTDGPAAELVIKDGLGDVSERTYEGTLPCADCPGIRYTLTLRNQEHSGDGVFELTTEYIDRDTFREQGTWLTLRGNADDPDATIYQLNPEPASEPLYFLYRGESLEMLDREQRKIESELNYTLKAVPGKN